MNLVTLLPSLTDDVRLALEAAGIITAHDILFDQASQIYHRLPANILSLREVSELQIQIAKRVSATVIRGDCLYNREEDIEKEREKCLCGVYDLDALLDGFGTHGIIEIAGDKKSGKTGLVLQIVLRHLAFYPDHTAFWLDIGGEFTIERAAAILQLNPGPASETALDRLSIFSCFDIAAAHRALEELRISLTHESYRRMRFLVVDPITPLFAPILTATSSQGHAIMTTFMRQVGSLTRTYFITALVTNSAVQSLPQNPYSAFSTTTSKPALGPSFSFLTDETLWLSNAQKTLQTTNDTVFIAEIFRSRNTLSKTWCTFVIRDGVSFEPFTSR